MTLFRIFYRLIKLLAFGILLAAAFSICINIYVVNYSAKHIIRNLDELPPKTAVLILGSQATGTTLSPVLRDRVVAGIKIMEAGKSAKMLLSGDHGDRYYDEVNAMRLYVLDHSNIAAENIFMDHAGFKTYDSMYRARDVFEVKDLVIVTQEFHISRAVYIARSLGLDAVGYAVEQDHFRKPLLRNWQLREYFARIKAVLSVITKAKPRYLGDKIPILGDGRVTWI
jgi:SanA protein